MRLVVTICIVLQICSDINTIHVNTRYLKVRFYINPCVCDGEPDTVLRIACRRKGIVCTFCMIASSRREYWHNRLRLPQDYMLPSNVVATMSAAEACAGAQYAIHAVPVQHSRAFLHAIKVPSLLAVLLRGMEA